MPTGESGRSAPSRGRRPERHRSTQPVRSRAQQERLRLVRRRRAIFALGVVVVVSVIAAGLLWLAPWFRVARIEVTGGSEADQREVHRLTDDVVGSALVGIDRDELKRRLSQVPSFSQVEVQRQWPDQVSVKVTLRVPVVSFTSAQGERRYADAAGVVFPAAGGESAGVPTAEVSHPDHAAEVTAVAAAMGVLDAQQRAKVGSLKVVSPDGVSFTVGRVKVIWGGAAQGAEKSLVLAALLQQKDVTTINVSAPDSPVTS
ncbi:Cell division protein FtsQ [Austwickia sp. TVS 96-490-7B]|uniref:cell division protein FtsQ/DivIB n=1 Tax=Austwickia sp. TVS 96-490-7B TaxID=2830843 RepID=UPI001C5676DA|nr:FtsQ-type POTRA domain-containing protein [Austwickia sp. TVS 96-490-7B]MBW3084401.1 Cell division protein FtsQ [Austwickia sp. TVS 96-490-7B]